MAAFFNKKSRLYNVYAIHTEDSTHSICTCILTTDNMGDHVGGMLTLCYS